MIIVLMILAFLWLSIGACAPVQRELFNIRRYLGMGVLEKVLGVPETDFEARANAFFGINLAFCSGYAIYEYWPSVQTVGVIIVVCPIAGALLTYACNRRLNRKRALANKTDDET